MKTSGNPRKSLALARSHPRQWIIRPFRPQLVIEAVGKIPLLDEGQHQTEPRRILAVRKDVVTAYVGGTWDEGIPDLADVPGREAVAGLVVIMHGEPKLLQVVDALGPPGCLACCLHCWQ